MSGLTAAVVGVGMVGRKMVEVLLERRFPASEIRVLATREREETIAGRRFAVRKTDAGAFAGVDVAFFAGTEGEKGAGVEFGRAAVAAGAVVIDNGADFRMDPQVPLVVPEVNGAALDAHRGIVANPNCSTIQMVAALCPLHRAYGLRRVVVSTYQAVSGTGRAAVAELEAQARAWAAGGSAPAAAYPHPVCFNLFPHIGSPSKDFPGYYTEEVKMLLETRKILGLPDLAVSATCVRVPVFNGHAEAVTAGFERRPDPAEARKLLAAFPGIVVIDDPASAAYPMPADASGRDEVFVGRVRASTALADGLEMWVVADNIRKGAASNAVQIAEEMLRRGLLKTRRPS